MRIGFGFNIVRIFHNQDPTTYAADSPKGIVNAKEYTKATTGMNINIDFLKK